MGITQSHKIKTYSAEKFNLNQLKLAQNKYHLIYFHQDNQIYYHLQLDRSKPPPFQTYQEMADYFALKTKISNFKFKLDAPGELRGYQLAPQVSDQKLPLEIEPAHNYPWNLYPCQPIVKHEQSFYYLHQKPEDNISREYYLLQTTSLDWNEKIKFSKCECRKMKKIRYRRKVYIIRNNNYLPHFYYSILELGENNYLVCL